MALVVYSRIGTVLQQRGMPLRDLRSRLASLLDSPIDPGSLVALARDERIQRPDIELLAAIARTLESPVDELLDVRDVRDAPNGADESHASPENPIVLDAARDQRRHHLIERRDEEDGAMTAAEQDELEALTTATASALIDRDIALLAASLGISEATARAHVEEAAGKAEAYWAALVANPDGMKAAIATASVQKRRVERTG